MNQAAVTTVVVGCLGVASFAGFYLIQLLRDWRRLREQWFFLEERRLHREGPNDFPREGRGPMPTTLPIDGRIVVSLVVTIIGTLAIAASTTLIDAKASDSGGSSTSSTPTQTPDPDPQSSAGGGEEFEGPVRTRHRVPKRRNGKALCLMRYTERASGKPWRGGKWWTSCRTGETLETIEEVKDVLALPARFGAVRDARTRALIPPRTRVAYREGRTAPQCEEDVSLGDCEGHVYIGGGWQYAFDNPERTERWIVSVECTREREDRASSWSPCAPGTR